MIKFYKILFISFIFFLSCDKSNIVRVTAQDLLEAAALEKGKKAVLINVWATWWSSCIAEFPFIRDLEKEYKDDLNVIFVSGDWLEQEKEVISFLKKMGITDELFIKNQPDEEFINGIHLEWTGTLPFTIVFGKLSGSIVDFWENSNHERRFIEAIEKAINL